MGFYRCGHSGSSCSEVFQPRKDKSFLFLLFGAPVGICLNNRLAIAQSGTYVFCVPKGPRRCRTIQGFQGDCIRFSYKRGLTGQFKLPYGRVFCPDSYRRVSRYVRGLRRRCLGERIFSQSCRCTLLYRLVVATSQRLHDASANGSTSSRLYDLFRGVHLRVLAGCRGP